MKYLVLFCTICLLGITACKTGKGGQGNNNNNSKKAFMPYDEGNFWVYELTDHSGSGIPTKNDTLKVLSHKQTDEGLKVDLNWQKWLIKADGDSIFIRCQARGGAEFLQLRYVKVAADATYSTCQGDVVMQVNAKKLAEPMEIKGKSYENCYSFEIMPYEKVYVAEGVGIIKREVYSVKKTLATELLLVSYKVK